MPGAEGRPPNKGGENKNDGRKGRRRYFRRKGDDAQAAGPERDAAPPANVAGQTARAADRTAADRRARNNRRKRRNKGKRLGGEARPLPAGDVVTDVNYEPPESVYIYTHVVRPDARESYEFRSEHFSSVGRKLEDYDIDLSSLFDEEGRVKTLRIPDEALRLLRDLEIEEETGASGEDEAPPAA
jgi:hypothetical protein